MGHDMRAGDIDIPRLVPSIPHSKSTRFDIRVEASPYSTFVSAFPASIVVWCWFSPALLTRTSSLPNLACTDSNAAEMDESLETSSCNADRSLRLFGAKL